MSDIYDPAYVKNLFDEMSATYERVNFLASFGFSYRWRQQFVEQAAIRPGMVVCDLMCGMGECWGAITRHLGIDGKLVALDFSEGMIKGAHRKTEKFAKYQLLLLQQDALSTPLRTASVDALICGFGIKTLSGAHLLALVEEVGRILKPGGTFSFVEVSVPEGWVFEKIYMHYLKHIVPIVGKILLGNPDNYRLLGEYTQRFRDCRELFNLLQEQGLRVNYDRYTYGCATGVSGVRV